MCQKFLTFLSYNLVILVLYQGLLRYLLDLPKSRFGNEVGICMIHFISIYLCYKMPERYTIRGAGTLLLSGIMSFWTDLSHLQGACLHHSHQSPTALVITVAKEGHSPIFLALGILEALFFFWSHR